MSWIGLWPQALAYRGRHRLRPSLAPLLLVLFTCAAQAQNAKNQEAEDAKGPTFTSLQPEGCLSPGTPLVLGGENLDRWSPQTFTLRMQDQRLTLKPSRWEADRVVLSIPDQAFRAEGDVILTLERGKWRSTLSLCAQERPIETDSRPDRPSDPMPDAKPTQAQQTPTAQEETPAPPRTETEAAEANAQPTRPPPDTTPETPEPPAEEPSAEESKEPSATEEEKPSAEENEKPSAEEHKESAAEADRQPPPRRTRPQVDRGGSLMTAGPVSTPPPPPPARSSRPDDDPTSSGAAPTDDIEPGELVLVSEDMPAAMDAARELSGYQLRIKSRSTLDQLGLVVSVFRLPKDADTRALVIELQNQLPHLSLDVNQRYQLMSDNRRRYGQTLLAWQPESTSCLKGVRIGLLDTGVNTEHPALINRPITINSFVRARPAPDDHGTAIASLWLGQPDAGFTPLIPDATLSVAAIFRLRGEQTDTTTDILVNALNWLLEQQVEAINLSLGGQENRIVTLVLDRLLEQNILLVAASGNLGPNSAPLYPAAQPGVLATTAVDASLLLYPDANRGSHLDFAAPGVQVWAASAAGTQYHTGTSYAVPFVLASLLAEKKLGNNWLERAQENSLDLGTAGRDSDFGWGLIQWPKDC